MTGSSRRETDFTPLLEEDFPALQRWLNTPHVLEWWDNPGPTLEQVREKYNPRVLGAEGVQCYIMRRHGEPIGFIQTYRVEAGEPEAEYVPDGEPAMGIDLFIGERAYLHRGLGSILLQRFIADILPEDVTAVVIDPSERNRIAIRAYEKAGFRHVTTFQRPEERDRTYLMVRNRSL